MKFVDKDNFDFNNFILENKDIIDFHLDKYLQLKYPQTLWESMRYTVLLEGKRIRPILALESARAFGGCVEDVIPTACAIEMVHAYSLIHDDLPCMDNDDFRRGKPTNHKVYGEAIAVLSGDALLSYAPQVIIQNTPDKVNKDKLLKVLEEFFITIGPSALVGGQVVDIESEGKSIDLSTFTYIHTNKTGELIKFAVRSGAILAGANSEQLDVITEYGKLIGYAFQIADDVLDIIGTKEELGKTPGKDAKTNKTTHPSLYGLAQSKDEVEYLCSQAQQVLIDNNIDTPGMLEIAGNIALKIQ